MLASEDDGGTLDGLRFSLASDIVELVVLTGDEAFLQTLREAVGNSRRLWHVPSADKVSDLLVAGEVGILVLDVQALNETAAVFIGQIKRQFPDMVVVVAGHRDAEIAIAGLISAGIVYRFIHKPMSPGRAKLFADAAVRKYEAQRRSAAPIPTARRKSRPARGWQVWGIGSVLAASLALAWVLHGGTGGDAGEPRTPAPVATRSPAADSPQLSQAAAQLAANHLTEPAGDNALELYLNALARNPGDVKARAGLAEVHERLLARAENALLEERLEEAASAIEVARQAGVESGRIAFLTAQLAKSRQQLKAAQTQSRSRNDAKAAPDPAPSTLNAVPRPESARVTGRAAAPPTVRAEPAMTPVVPVAENAGAAAAAAVNTGAGTGAGTIAGADAATRAGAGANETATRQPNAATRMMGIPSGEPGAAQQELDPALARREFLTRVIPANDLTLVKSVQPVYPSKAERNNTQGWVELDFTVADNGAVTDIAVHAASAPGVFEDAAMRALSQWRYRPVIRDAKPVPQRARIRIRFSLAP